MQIISPWEIAWLFKKSTVWLCCSVEQEEGDADAPVQPIWQRCPCSRDVLLSLSPRLTPSRVSRKPRASEPCAGPACVHPNASSTSQHPRGSAQQLRAPSLPAAVARRLPGSALLGRGSFLPSLRPAHRPAQLSAPSRGSAPGRAAGTGWYPSPCLPRASPERHCWEGEPGLMSPVLYPPLPTLLGFGPASSTCGLSSPLWAFLPLPFLWLWMSPQTRFYESGLVQGLYKVFSEIRGPVICKTNKNVQ